MTDAALSQPRDFDPRIAEIRADPYPLMADLRASEPVHWSQALNSWVLTAYDDVKLVLNDPRFSADRISPFRDSLAEPQRNRIKDLLATLGDWMVFSDPPKHTRLRRLANVAFPTRAMDDMEPRVVRLVGELLDRVEARDRFDIIGDLGFPLPVMVIADMLGVPHDDQEDFKRWSDDLAAFVGSAQATGDKRDIAQASVKSLYDYFDAAVAERRTSPRDDRMTIFMQASDENDDMSHEEMISTLVLLLFAGHETTTNLIGNGMLAMLQSDGELGRLGRGEVAPEVAVDEILRFDGPTLSMTRIALEDTEVGGQAIDKGHRVFAMLGGANRDPAVFEGPDRLDLGRTPNRHLSFGYGIHFCLGAPLARLEGRIALGELARRFPKLDLVDRDPEWIDSLALRGVKKLEVTV